MANENYNNQPWKKLLEDEVALSGDGLADKAAAWQQLHYRLHQQSYKKRLMRYWVAAAILLLLTVPFIYLQHNNSSLVKNAAPEKEISDSSKRPPLAKHVTPVIKSIANVPSITTKSAEHKAESSTRSVAVDADSDSDLIVKKKEENIVINSFSPLLVDSISVTAVATVQPKKQLKVVHINELGDPITASSILTHNTEPHAFELQIGKEEVVSNTASNFSKPHFAVITIKTSPTN